LEWAIGKGFGLGRDNTFNNETDKPESEFCRRESDRPSDVLD
jgi:hypothetical protein